jgi:hypothetical protein
VTYSKAASIAGLVLCLISIIPGQIALSLLPVAGAKLNADIAQDIGYTFTGLTAALGFILWKWGRRADASSQTITRYWSSRLLQAVAAMLPILFGCAYFYIVGGHVERHARTFAALPPFVYLLAIANKK